MIEGPSNSNERGLFRMQGTKQFMPQPTAVLIQNHAPIGGLQAISSVDRLDPERVRQINWGRDQGGEAGSPLAVSVVLPC